MIWPGRKGEIILENGLDARYVRTGAWLAGNTALNAITKELQKETRSGRLGEMVLAPELMPEVIESQEAIAKLSPFAAPFLLVYPRFGRLHIEHLNGSPSDRAEWDK